MSAEEIIGRLSPAIHSPERFGHARKSISAFDVAGAIGMARLPAGPDYLIRVDWAMQKEFLPELTASLYMRLSGDVDFTKLSRRPEHTPGLIFDICRVSIDDFLSSKICHGCNGTAETLTPEGKKIKCLDCGGIGIRSGKRHARFLALANDKKIAWRTFQRHWWPLVCACFDLLGRWERVGLASMGFLGSSD